MLVMLAAIGSVCSIVVRMRCHSHRWQFDGIRAGRRLQTAFLDRRICKLRRLRPLARLNLYFLVH